MRGLGMVTQMSASSLFASIHRRLPLHRSSGSFPLKRRFAKPDSKEAIRCWYPSTLWACVLALRATQMSHCFMAVDAIDF